MSDERGHAGEARRIILTPNDLHEADRRADPDQRDRIAATYKFFGVGNQARLVLELLGRADEIPDGWHVRKVWRSDADLGNIIVEVSS